MRLFFVIDHLHVGKKKKAHNLDSRFVIDHLHVGDRRGNHCPVPAVAERREVLLDDRKVEDKVWVQGSDKAFRHGCEINVVQKIFDGRFAVFDGCDRCVVCMCFGITRGVTPLWLVH